MQTRSDHAATQPLGNIEYVPWANTRTESSSDDACRYFIDYGFSTVIAVDAFAPVHFAVTRTTLTRLHSCLPRNFSDNRKFDSFALLSMVIERLCFSVGIESLSLQLFSGVLEYDYAPS